MVSLSFGNQLLVDIEDAEDLKQWNGLTDVKFHDIDAICSKIVTGEILGIESIHLKTPRSLYTWVICSLDYEMIPCTCMCCLSPLAPHLQRGLP